MSFSNPNLAPCPDCGRKISKSARWCPGCGRPGRPMGMSWAKKVMVALSLLGILSGVAFYLLYQTKPEVSKPQMPTPRAKESKGESPKNLKKPGPKVKKDKKAKISYWTCSMHPQVKQPQRGKCSICKMDLVPVKK